MALQHLFAIRRGGIYGVCGAVGAVARQAKASFDFTSPDRCAGTVFVGEEPGPRQAHKLPPEVMAFLERARAADPALRAPALAQRVQGRFGYAVHPRSIERAFARAEKKRP